MASRPSTHALTRRARGIPRSSYSASPSYALHVNCFLSSAHNRSASSALCASLGRGPSRQLLQKPTQTYPQEQTPRARIHDTRKGAHDRVAVPQTTTEQARHRCRYRSRSRRMSAKSWRKSATKLSTSCPPPSPPSLHNTSISVALKCWRHRAASSCPASVGAGLV